MLTAVKEWPGSDEPFAAIIRCTAKYVILLITSDCVAKAFGVPIEHQQVCGAVYVMSWAARSQVRR